MSVGGTMFDVLLTAILVVLLPAYMLWRSLRARGKAPESRLVKYLRTITMAAALAILVIIEWLYTRRPFASLGLAAPNTVAAMIGLCLAVCLLVVMAVSLAIRLRSEKPQAKDDPSKEIMPQTSAEMAVFIVFSFVVGTAWELLYRGYLLWSLAPHIGLFLSVVISATAYGVGHGFRNTKMLLASLASALVFTTAYAITRNLWWLMLVHCGLPLIGAVASKLSRGSDPSLITDQGMHSVDERPTLA